MSSFCNNYFGFRNFCLNNFPFLEKDFDALTDYELISKIFEYLEKQIKEVDEKYSGIGETVESLSRQFEQLKLDINETLSGFETDINNQVDLKLQQNYNQVVQLISNYQTVVENELTALEARLQAQIEQIELGNVIAYNPTTGEYENVSKVIMDVYNTLRVDAITCTEFDGLELTATEFDAYEITAYNFDVNGKELLMGA